MADRIVLNLNPLRSADQDAILKDIVRQANANFEELFSRGLGGGGVDLTDAPESGVLFNDFGEVAGSAYLTHRESDDPWAAVYIWGIPGDGVQSLYNVGREYGEEDSGSQSGWIRYVSMFNRGPAEVHDWFGDYVDFQNTGGAAIVDVFCSWFYAENTGHIDNLWGYYANGPVNSGTIGKWSPFYVKSPSGAGTITDAFAFYCEDLTDGATHPYFLWLDAPAVYRIKGDGIMAYYNPTFEKYVPGAVNFERIVQQWDTDVAEYGVEVGGTGVLRKLRLLGSSIILPPLPTANPNVVGELWLDSGVMKQSAG